MKGKIEKGILYLPADFPIEEGIAHLTRGQNDCPMLLTSDQWFNLEEKIKVLPDPQKCRRIQHFLMSYLYQAEVADRKIMIPSVFMEKFLREGPYQLQWNDRGYYSIIQEDLE